MSDFTRIGSSQEWDHITHRLMELKAQFQMRQLHSPREAKQLGDYSHLNSVNLEELHWIDEAAPRLTIKEIPLCGRCDDGWLRVEHTRNCVKLCHYCELPRRRAKRLNKLELPADSVGMHLGRYIWDSPDQERRITSMLNHLNGSQRLPHCPSSYLWGPPGNGKTSLLYCLARWGCFSDLRVTYISHTNLMNQIKEGFGDNKRRDPLRGWLDQTDLLLLDELGGLGGNANKTAWYVSQTTEILGSIYERWSGGKLGVVMTSNLQPQQLAQVFGRNVAALSRLRAMFGSPIQMTGPDRRQSADERLKEWGL